MVKLQIDFEFPSREWWESGGQDLWDGISDGFDGSSVVVDESVAESWLAAAEQLPGWDGGHEYAPHPVIVAALDEDEDV